MKRNLVTAGIIGVLVVAAFVIGGQTTKPKSTTTTKTPDQPPPPRLRAQNRTSKLRAKLHETRPSSKPGA